MSETDPNALFARLLHHRAAKLAPGDSVVPPITLSAPFHLPGEPSNAPFQYGRFHNPTWEALEDALTLLEGAESVLFPSGMAAIAATFKACVGYGDSVLLPSDGYYTTRLLAEKLLGPMKVSIKTRSTAAFLDGGFEGYSLVLMETPSNPGLDMCDIRVAAAEADRVACYLAVDNTTMTPLGQRPLELGADIAISSDTKAVSGHSDVLLGHIATRNQDVLIGAREWRKLSGAIAGPFEAWLAYRGLETLEVRFERMCATAGVIAERLKAHPKVLAVRYPGLQDDPSHAIATRQMRGFGFMLSLTLADDAQAERFMDLCPLLQQSTSFGGVRTSAERRSRWGDAVAPGFVRMSVGLEPAEPLWAALNQALEKA